MISPSAISPLNRRVVEGASFVGLLDTYGGAAAAYSVRRLSSTYSGALMEVRRSSDNTVQDIGFNANGDLDTTALLAFVGAGDGFVRTWYDQSGNGNDAQQTTVSQQPLLISAGTLNTKNNKPVISKLSTSTEFNISNISANYWAFSVINSSGASNLLFSNGLGIYNLASQSGISSTVINSGIVTYYKNGSIYSPANRGIIYNDLLDTQTLISLTHNEIVNTIGYGNTFFGMYNLQEVVFYESNQSSNRTGIESNINSYFSIYP